ncbi:MAG: SPOR domain-containing protein [Bacteroidales bacterium]|nr:SPOR domain-containing protein [Bacteroidales bacterium]
MDKYIKQLTDKEQRVIVPGLGAFQVIPEGGIMFNQYLNFDDNMLTNYVAEQVGISQDEASRRVHDYSSEQKQRLDNGETITIEGIGSIKSTDGKYEFSESIEESPNKINLIDNMVETTEEQQENVQEAVETAEETKTTTTYIYEEDNSRRNLFIILAIVLLFLIGVILCLFVFNKDNCVYNFFFGEEEKVEKVETVVQPKAEPVEEKDSVVVEPIKKIASERRYNIIVGTYNSEAAAANRVKQLQAKGFENATVGTFRNNYVAIIDSYDRLPEAEARQEYIVDTYRIESYITNSGE